VLESGTGIERVIFVAFDGIVSAAYRGEMARRTGAR
jgi:hypothetical protein